MTDSDTDTDSEKMTALTRPWASGNHGFEIRTDTDSEKMTVQIRLRYSGHDWHTLTRWATSDLVEDLDRAVSRLQKAENKRRLTSTQRARFRELLKAHTEAPLDETELEELRRLDRAVRYAGVDVFGELAAAFSPGNDKETPSAD